MSLSKSSVSDAATHVASLQNLKSKDSEFYKYLEENDPGLLDFSGSEDDDVDDSQLAVDEAVAEESDSEDASDIKELKRAIVSEELKNAIKNSPNIKVFKQLVLTFKRAIQQTNQPSSESHAIDGDFFEDVVKLCLVEVVPALHKILKLPMENIGKCNPTKSKSWKKISTCLKSYFIHLGELFSVMSDPSNITLILKHVISLIPFFLPFVKLSRILLKKVISLWCTNEETVRVLSLLIIVRISREMPKEYQGHTFKLMYMSYVKNAKYTSPSTWPLINFMRRSLVEVYSLNPEIAYEHAFVYIRQLSIHLRNALTMKKKESYQAVYNWQYIHCIMLWAHLLSVLYESSAIKTLVYPLVQNIIGTINLIPTIKYAPLRVHLIRVLIQISKETNTFISVPPIILDILGLINFNKKSAFSKKPINMSCALKGSKAQLQEAGFKESVINEVCSLLFEYFQLYAHTIGFPELVLPAIVLLKTFLKKCKVSKFSQRLKLVLDKLQENSNYITEKRKSIGFKITDDGEVKRWEENLPRQDIPLVKYCTKNVKQGRNIEPPMKKQKLNE